MSQLIVLVILIFLNAFFAATEMAFVTLNDAKTECIEWSTTYYR